MRSACTMAPGFATTISPRPDTPTNAAKPRSIETASRTSSETNSTFKEEATACMAPNGAAASGNARVAQDAYRGHARSDILQQLEPFRAKAEIIAGESGDVAARPRETLDEATADRVEDLHEHDRNRPGLLLECGDHRGRVRHNRVRLHRH